jgi:exopolyphosphatase/guanosine-5'-triphosphate,3'-diphosphate pyrophosphatase
MPKYMTRKIAIIDMGTNTFHLLIAKATANGYTITQRERTAVKIGKGGINQGYITEEGLTRALLAMQSFKNIIDEQGIKNVKAFGTSALRNAENGPEVLRRIKEVSGIEATIISGDVEAEYIYHGVRYSLEIGNEKSLIVDIGGGSVECIIGDGSQIFWKRSFEIGAQRLLEEFHKSDPIRGEEIQRLDQHFKNELSPLFEAIRQYPTNILIGASGTFDTLSDIYCHQNNIFKADDQPETPLTINGFCSIYAELISKTREQRMQIPGMIEMRVDMIVVACCLVRFILSHHTFNRIRVSSYSLKEGVLASSIEIPKSFEPSIL